MATIRKRGDRYQVQVRRKGQAPLSMSFTQYEDARRWARMMEAKADTVSGDLPDLKALQGVTLGQLVARYRDEISPRHRGSEMERTVLNAFLRDEEAPMSEACDIPQAEGLCLHTGTNGCSRSPHPV